MAKSLRPQEGGGDGCASEHGDGRGGDGAHTAASGERDRHERDRSAADAVQHGASADLDDTLEGQRHPHTHEHVSSRLQDVPRIEILEQQVVWAGEPREDAVDDSGDSNRGHQQEPERPEAEAAAVQDEPRHSDEQCRGGRLRLCECGEPDRRAGDDEDPFPWRIADAAECNQEHEHADQAESRCRGVWQDEVVIVRDHGDGGSDRGRQGGAERSDEGACQDVGSGENRSRHQQSQGDCCGERGHADQLDHGAECGCERPVVIREIAIGHVAVCDPGRRHDVVAGVAVEVAPRPPREREQGGDIEREGAHGDDIRRGDCVTEHFDLVLTSACGLATLMPPPAVRPEAARGSGGRPCRRRRSRPGR